MHIPMSQPDVGDDERAAVDEVLRGTTLALGPRLALFEERVAGYVGVRHAAGVSSGTAGLHLGLLAAGVRPGDVVVTTPFSFIASANCALYVGARPAFVDVEPVALTLDPERLERTVRRLLRRGERVRAIVPVHVFGQAADMDPIMAVARRYGLAVVEDACEAIGTQYRGRPAGTLGDAAVFAFYPNKQMTTGEGGMIVTDLPAWDRLFRSLRNQGRDDAGTWLEHVRLGYNYRLDELSAALGAVQIARLDDLLARRAQVAAWYGERLAGVCGVALPAVAEWTTRTSWFVYVVRLDPRVDRDAVVHALAQRGVPARAYFPPIHLQPFYRRQFGFRPGDFPVAEAAGATCLALPFFTAMRVEQIDVVAGALEEVLCEARDAAPHLRRALG